jgi:hypothetical protein
MTFETPFPMIDEFKIYVDRLKDGDPQKIEGVFEPRILEIDEQDLQFHKPIHIASEAYTTDEDLIIRVTAWTHATMPCAICNEPTETRLSCADFYVIEPLSEIKGAVYDFTDALREGLLTEIPPKIECNQGSCPSRPVLEKYLRKDEETSSPFKDIDLEQ